MNKSKMLLALFAGIVVIISAWLLARGATNFRKESPQINVTGMAEKQITSDLIVWSIVLNSKNRTRASAYADYKRTEHAMRQYLKSHGIVDSMISTSSANISAVSKQIYDPKRQEYVSIDDEYEVSQTFTIRSTNLPLVEKVYQNISELYNDGLDFTSYSPLYYYTKLNNLKMEMLNKASANAYERAQTIAKGSEASIGSMVSSSMGVFQIVGLNSSEQYSWGGTFNTDSKEKVASITVRATYEVK